MDHNWMAGVLVCQQFIPAANHVPILLTADWEKDVFARWFERHRPDAIVGLELEAIAWLGKLGLRIPEDVGFAHLDCQPPWGSVAGVDQRSELVGSATVDLVVSQINRGEQGIPPEPKVVLIEGRWIEGATVRRQRRGSR